MCHQRCTSWWQSGLQLSSQKAITTGNLSGSLPGLTPQECNNLKECGIETTLQLLQQARKLPSRQKLAAQMQVHIQHVTKWAAMADLARIPSVGCEYCGLLLHAGVGSVSQLAQIPLHKLQQQIIRFQVANTRNPDLCPDAGRLALWIQQAQQLTSRAN